MKLPDTNWFDLVVLAMLMAGMIRGRMRGMSEELLPLLQWLSILFVGAYTNEPAGRFLHTFSALPLVYCRLAVYLFAAVLLKWIFTALKHVMGDRLLTANAFGKGEYFFGTFAGAARFGCMVLMCLALLHAFYVPETRKPVAAKPLESDTGFLDSWSPESVKQAALSRSFVGPVVRQHLSTLLLKPEAPPAPSKETKPTGPVQKHKRAVNEVINPK